MALFDTRLADEITGSVRARYRTLGKALGEPEVEGIADGYGPLQEDLELLIGIANGEHVRTARRVRQAEKALDRLMDLLFGHAYGGRATVPDDFWGRDMGVMASRVRWWVSMDDLITISNAAALAYGENTQANRMRIARAIDRGELEWALDPSVSNPQQNRRVLRSQVERLARDGDGEEE